MAKVKNEQIPDLNVSWENYSGASVESFIKSEFKKSCGYIYRSQSREGDYYYLYGFRSIDDYLNWQTGEDITPLFKVLLPNMDNDILSVSLSTNTNTKKLVNLGDGVTVSIRYTSTSTNLNTKVTSDTYNDGTLIISRSSNGSTFTEVGRITILPQSNNSTAFLMVDITKYLTNGDNKIRMKVEDNVNGSVSNVITFQSIVNTKLVVKDATDNTKPLTSLNLSYYIEGQIKKTLHVKVTDASGNTESFEVAIGDSTYIEIPYSFLVDRLFATGIINVETWLTVDETSLESSHITSQYFFIAEDSDESIIILNNTAKIITNYTNTRFFDFTLFNKTSDVTIVIADTNTEYLNYTYKNCEIGKRYSFYNTLEIESNLDSISAVVKVSTKDMASEYNVTIDNSVKMSPTEGADFVLNPKTRNNTEEAPGTIDNVTATFTNFDFNNDGWVTDSDGIGVLRIPRGRKLSIGYDPLDNLTNGTTIEFDYKIYNVYNEDNVVFKFCSYKDSMPLGFEMKATEAVFITTEKQTKRDLDIVFLDGVRTHVTINIVPNLSGSGLNYIRIFVNGIMNREIIYTDSDIFKNGALTMDFGAEDCDLDIYGIRIYKKGLSASDVRLDYMSCLPDMESKLAFRDANDIVSSNGTISFDKASVKYNTLVWTGEHPEYKTGDLKYTGNLTINIIDSPEHSGTINNMKIKGLGSSSKGYWKWNHQYDFNSDSVWTDGNGEVRGVYYQLSEGSPKAKKLVAKRNWASSMQSHKMGATALFTDLWKSIVGGNSITKTLGYEDVRVSVEEKPFMYFIKETDDSTPVFDGLVTFGSGKADVATFQGDKTVFGNYLMVEGSDNGTPLTLRLIPWIDEEVTYNEDEEYFEYNGEGLLDFDLGNRDNISYFKNAFNFAYLHSTRLKPYTEDSELLDESYQYWNTSTYNVVRYNPITKTWVNGGITKDDEGYAILNIQTQTSITPSGNKETDNTAFINWRKTDFKANIANYYNVNDVLYCMAFLKLIAASDNRCKNTYEYLDPTTFKICMLLDDVDTIFLTDNVGRKTKPYYVEEHDKNGTNYYWNGEDNVFYNLMEEAFDVEYKAMMKAILDKMASTEFGGSAEECLNKYFFSIQKYFPSVAYNETARLYYEEASVALANGTYKNGTPAISQSLGDLLLAEKQWWKRRLPYMLSYALSNPFYVRSLDSLGFRSTLTTESTRPSYTFNLTTWQWIYPKIGVGLSMGADTTRVLAKDTYTTSTINADGNTDTFIYGADYYTSFGEFADKSIGETFELSGHRLLEFSADSRNITGVMQFRPIAMKVSCPNLRKLTLYGVSTLTGNLDLSGCTKIESVDLRGTNLNTVIFPSTSTLTDISIPNLASLSITGCKSLDSFYYEDLSNLMALTTDNGNILETVLSSASNLAEVHLEGINYTATEGNSDKLYNLLISDKSTATGTISLAKSLTFDEKNNLIKLYGNIDDKSNSLYITYTIVSADSFEIIGDTSITQSESKEYSVSYTGNDSVSVEWAVSNATYKANGAFCTITALEDNANSIVISCKVNRITKDALIVNKEITVKELVYITSISLLDYDICETGVITIPIKYNPTTYNVAIYDVKARIESNDYVTVESVGNDLVTLNCSQLVTSKAVSLKLTVDVTDVRGNKITGSSQISVHNPIKYYYLNGYSLDTNPTIANKIQDSSIIFTITADVGSDEWYIDSVTPTSTTVTATVTSTSTFTLATSTEVNTTVKIKIKFNNRDGEKNFSFTWKATPDFDNLCFTSTGDSAISFIYDSSKSSKATLYISKDEQNWELWDYSSVSLTDGELLFVYGTEFQLANYSRTYSKFSITGNIKVSGDLAALRDGSTVTYSYDYCNLFEACSGLTDASELVLPKKFGTYGFYQMFYECSSLVKTPKLPSTQITNYCYDYMFRGCTSLTKATELPATTLASGCYSSMFYGCTSLVEAPELPATTLASGCYSSMFYGCTSLVEAPELPATTLEGSCYSSMFSGCTKLTKAPKLPATTLSNYCYMSMFYRCTSLTKAPELPATTLVYSCYNSMFLECSKLNYLRALFIKDPSGNCALWVKGVSSTGTFIKNYLAEWEITGVSGVPSGWTVEYNATHISYDSLTITSDNVIGNATSAVVHYNLVESLLTEDGKTILKTYTGNAVSDTFERNTSTTDSRTITVSYTEPKSGLTATTTITQGVWVELRYTVDLNSLWQKSETNPDSTLYDCYESFSNYLVNSGNAIMYITINGYSEFSIYIRSYGESNYDYVVVGNLDDTSISRKNSGVKATTYGNAQSGTTIGSYTKVTFSNLDGGEHKIPILYGKDSSGSSGTDKGYVIIEKNQ